MKIKVGFAVIASVLISTLSGSAASGISITGATGGSNISADKAANAASPAWTTLTGGITIDEGTGNSKQGFIGGGLNATLILKAPTGFEFDTAAPAPNITIVNAPTDLSAPSVTVASGSVTIKVNVNGAARNDTITIGNTTGLRVRPISGNVLTNGIIYRPTTGGGTMTLNSLATSSSGNGAGADSFGTLSMVVGNATQLVFTQQPAGANVGANFATQPIIRTRDQFGNNSTTGLTGTVNVTTALAAGSGPLTGTTVRTLVGGVITHTDLRIGSAGSDKQLSASFGALTNGLSSVFTVGKGSQTITFPAIANHTFGDASFGISFSASSGLAVTLDVSGPASVTGTNVTITGAGLVTITASQAGDANWNAAADVVRSFTVAKATPTVTWNNPSDIVYGTALDGTQLNASGSVPGAVDYTPAATTVLNAGNNQVLSGLFIPTDTANYSNVTKTVLINVAKADQTITFGALSDKVSTDVPFTVSATNSSPLPVTFSIFTGPATISIDTVTLTGTLGPVTVRASQAGNTNYNAAVDVDQTFNVNSGTPTITWNTPSDLPYNTALSTNQLNATANVPGAFAYTPDVGTFPLLGTNELSVTFTPTDTVSYATVTTNVFLIVVKATPSITWANPADITFGAVLTTNELNATANVPGVFTYTPAEGFPLDSGAAQTLSVSFVPEDTTNYNNTSATASINVLKASSGLSWSAPSDIVYGTLLSSTQLNASATVAGAFTYTPDTNASLTAGSQNLSVSFVPDNTNYAAATANVSLTVLKASTTISWGNPADITYGTALSGVQLNANGSIPGTMVYTPAAPTVLDAGTNTLSATFTPTDSANYDGTNATVSIVVNKATPVLTWNNPGDITYGTLLSSTQLNASADIIGGTFTYNPTNDTLLGVGDGQVLSVDYVPANTNNYNSASKTALINVVKATPSITWANPANITYGAVLTTNELNATANVSGTFTYTPALGVPLNAGAGQTLSVSFVPDDTANYTNTTATASITVLKATPTITWNTPAGITYGTPINGTQLNASAGAVLGTMTYSPTNGAILNAGNPTLNASFVPDDTTNYNNANGSVVINVAKAPVTITWNNPADINYGTPLSVTQLNASAPVAGAFVYSPTFTTVVAAGSPQTLSVTFTPSSANYSNATATASINVLKVPLTIKANDATRLVGASNPSFTATYTGFVAGNTAASLTTPVTFTTPADNLSPAGFYGIVPSGATSGNYNITFVDGTLTVSPTSTIVSTTTGGLWSAVGTWVGGIVPGPADNAVIAAGATVSVDIAAECFSLILSNTASAVPALTIQAAKSLMVGGGAGLVTIGQNVTPNNGMLNNVLTVSGALNCGNVNMVARRVSNNDKIHAFLRLNNAAAVVTVTNNVTLDRNTTAAALLAQVELTAAGTFKIGGGFVQVNQGGSLTATAGTVEYYATGNQTIFPASYVNLVLSGAGVKTGSAGVNIAATGTLTLKDTVSYAGVTPTYASGATLLYGRTGVQLTGTEIPAAPPAVWNLSVSNAAGVTLSQSASVPGTLRLIAGNLNTGANTLTANGTTVRTAGYVVGNLKKSFAIGAGVARTFEVGSTAYNPVAITIANVSVAGSLTVAANAGDSSVIGTSILDASKSVNANWNINKDGTLALSTYGVTFNYTAGDLDGGADSSLLILGDYSSGSWSYPAVATRTATSLQANGLTGFSTFQLAENGSKTVSTISWTPPGAITYGTALDGTQLNASPSTAGIVTYSPASTTVLDAGNGQILTASFVPADPANYTAATNTVGIDVDKANLSVTADSFVRFFGEANPTFTGVLSGVVNSDNITATYLCSATQGTAPGVYTITAGLNPSARLVNYNVSSTDGSLTINELPILNISGNYTLQVTGPTNVTYTIQATETLDSGWQTIGTTTLNGGVQEFQDVAPTNALRFYRIAQ
ncbi:MAG: dystroglycan-type cadherin-like domain repeat protein [Verrucomicrobiales bacterium]|nr:dystroglycan-type cadherin-like domain repeat protein [Verrucomicrobiales bacterium]